MRVQGRMGLPWSFFYIVHKMKNEIIILEDGRKVAIDRSVGVVLIPSQEVKDLNSPCILGYLFLYLEL